MRRMIVIALLGAVMALAPRILSLHAQDKPPAQIAAAQPAVMETTFLAATEAYFSTREPEVTRFIAREKRNKYPVVVFLPGILGSKLVRVNPVTQKRKTIWGAFKAKHLFYPPEDLTYRESDKGNVEASPLYDFKVQGVPVDIYGEGLSYIKNQALSDGETLLAFPYDWRQDNEISGDDLNSFLCRNRAELAGREVVFVAHSMGGLVLKSWFKKHFEQKKLTCKNVSIDLKVDRAIFLGTPHMGSPKAIKSLAIGFQLIANDKTLFGSIFGSVDEGTLASALNKHGATFQSVYQLLPVYGSETNCIKRVANDPPEPVIVKTGGPAHSRFDLFSADAWKAAGWPKYIPKGIAQEEFYAKNGLLQKRLDRAEEFLCGIAAYEFPEEIKVTIFYGQQAEPSTDQTYVIDLTKKHTTHKEADYAWGDGTVPSTIAKDMWHKQPDPPRYVPNKHGDLLKAQAFKSFVWDIYTQAQMFIERRLVADARLQSELLNVAAQSGTIPRLLPNAKHWDDPELEPVRSFILKTNLDAEKLLEAARNVPDDDSSRKTSLLAAAAVAKGATPAIRAKAAQETATVLFQNGDWVGATQSADAARTYAEAISEDSERLAIMAEAFKSAGWANLQLGQGELGNQFLYSSKQLGHQFAYEPPKIADMMLRNDMPPGKI